MQKTIYSLLILMLFSGCQNLAVEEKIIENYYFIASDEVYGTCLSYHEDIDESIYGCIIDAAVFAVGFNDKYMIVKQHPRTFPNPPDMKITNYYILPLKKGMNWKIKNGLIGPITLEQFNEKRKELKISDEVTFTKEIEDLK